MILVHTTEHGLGFVLLTVISAAEVEGDDGLVKKALRNHIVEWWNDLIDADSIITETHNPIKATEGKSKPGFLSSFSKILVLDDDVSDLKGIP